jgi:hypothetical protein
MANMVYPSPRYRSVTAVEGYADAHDGMAYSAALLQYGGAPSPLKLFSVQFGQSIVNAKGSGITASTNAWQTTYTYTTTNLDRPSQLGDNLGDAAIRGIGVTIEQASYTFAAATKTAWGADDVEVTDILRKCAGELKIGNKPQFQAPVWGYPQLGGAAGSLFSTANAASGGLVSNGALPIGREFRTPMMLGRYDSIVFELSIASGASFVFSNSGTDGQPTLLWCALLVDFLSDVR